jgi:hypothetical protein
MKAAERMWLVLCAPTDLSAIWAYEGLKSRGLEPIRLVTTESLVYGVRWEHRVGASGVCVDITLPDGSRIRNTDLRGVLNRIQYIPPGSLLLIRPADRDYVLEELGTFFLSWLYALPRPMLNRPTPQGLSGQWRHVSEWLCLAARAGLPTANYRQSSHDLSQGIGIATSVVPPGTPVTTVLVVDGQVAGPPAPAHILEGCLRLGALSKTQLLGAEFTVGPGNRWTFVGATTHPDLRLGGDRLLDLLARALVAEPGGKP